MGLFGPAHSLARTNVCGRQAWTRFGGGIVSSEQIQAMARRGRRAHGRPVLEMCGSPISAGILAAVLVLGNAGGAASVACPPACCDQTKCAVTREWCDTAGNSIYGLTRCVGTCSFDGSGGMCNPHTPYGVPFTGSTTCPPLSTQCTCGPAPTDYIRCAEIRASVPLCDPSCCSQNSCALTRDMCSASVLGQLYGISRCFGPCSFGQCRSFPGVDVPHRQCPPSVMAWYGAHGFGGKLHLHEPH